MLLTQPTAPIATNYVLCMLSSCLGQCASSSSSKQQPSAAASTLRRRRRRHGCHPGEALAILAAGYTAANMLQHYHIAEPELKPAL